MKFTLINSDVIPPFYIIWQSFITFNSKLMSTCEILLYRSEVTVTWQVSTPPLSYPAHMFVLNTWPSVYLVELHFVTSTIGISACFNTSRQQVPEYKYQNTVYACLLNDGDNQNDACFCLQGICAFESHLRTYLSTCIFLSLYLYIYV